MAIYIAYRKIRQTETEVEYAHGPSPDPDKMAGRLVLDARDPKTPAIRGAEAETDGWLVSGKIRRLRLHEGTWPETGALES